MSRSSIEVLTHVPPALLARVADEVPQAHLTPIPETGPLPRDASGEVLLTWAWGSANLADVVERGVRWVHAYGTGVDGFPCEALGAQTLTCSRGASAIPISEWVLACVLAFEKRLPDAWIHEPPPHWNRADLGGVHGQTLGLVGLGGIGQAVAERARAFGMRVVACRRTRAPSPIGGVEVVDEVGEVLSRADHLVLASPATPETRALINRDTLGRARLGLHLVNVARGELVDQEALREALDSGRVARASLDVVDPEPLPAGHWLYTHPKVRLSPHTSWVGPGALDRFLDPFLENLRRFAANEPLVHVVDVKLGY